MVAGREQTSVKSIRDALCPCRAPARQSNTRNRLLRRNADGRANATICPARSGHHAPRGLTPPRRTPVPV
jgi:hypothetical protein